MMMSAITLGTAPGDLSVILSPGAGFTATIRRKDGTPWDATPITLKLGSATWTASTSADVASFSESSDAVDAVIAARPDRAQLRYGNLLWAAGYVSVRA